MALVSAVASDRIGKAVNQEAAVRPLLNLAPSSCAGIRTAEVRASESKVRVGARAPTLAPCTDRIHLMNAAAEIAGGCARVPQRVRLTMCAIDRMACIGRPAMPSEVRHMCQPAAADSHTSVSQAILRFPYFN